MSRAARFATWPTPGAAVSPATLAREFAALARASLAPPPFPDDAARGNGQPAIVIPGFLAPDLSTARLRAFLLQQGFAAASWTCGLNLGPMPDVVQAVSRQLHDIAAAGGRPVTLIGVSLGGTTAREVAKACPAAVARVITLVSPIHLPVTTPLAPLAEAAALLWDMTALAQLEAIAEPPSVPLTAVVSPDDGVIDWQASRPAPADGVEVVEVASPHMTICAHPAVQRLVAERLAAAP